MRAHTWLKAALARPKAVSIIAAVSPEYKGHPRRLCGEGSRVDSRRYGQERRDRQQVV